MALDLEKLGGRGSWFERSLPNPAQWKSDQQEQRMSWSPKERTGAMVMLGSKYLIVKDGTGLECSEDREEQRQFTGPLDHTEYATFQSSYGIWSNDSPWFSSFNFCGPYDYPECQGKHILAGLSLVISPSLCTYCSQFSSVQSLSHVWLFATPWITARQASLSITNSQSSPQLMSIKLVVLSSHLILCRPLLLLPPIPPSVRVFSNESTLRMR